MKRIVLALSSLALLASIGCGGSGGGSGSTGNSGNGGAAGETTTTSGTSSQSCCINGQNYDCPSQEAANACGGGDGSQCTPTTQNPSGTCG